MPEKKKTSNPAISMLDLERLLRDNLRALWDGQAFLQSGHAGPAALIPPIMVWGAPGVGKSTMIRELAASLGIGFIDVRLAQREPVDMRGLPVPENGTVKWLVSSEWPRDPASRGIILFDELTAADKTLQVASYEFILDRRLGDLYSVPPGWYIMAAGNRVEDRAVSCAMSSALANRFLHVEIKPDAESFLTWAVSHNVHQAVINFIRYRPELLFSQEGEDLQRGWPSPRSWERVSTMLKIAEEFNNLKSLKFAVPGLVGNGAAVEFLAFYKNMYYANKKLDLARELQKGGNIPIPDRPDQLYACCGALNYYMEMERDNRVFQLMLPNFLQFALKLPNDFSHALMSDLLGRLAGKPRLQAVTSHPLYAEWLRKIEAK